MKSAGSSVLYFLRNNIGLSIILTGELAVILWMFVTLFAKSYSISVDLSDLTRSDGNTTYVSMEQGILQVANAGAEGLDAGEITPISLESGNYQIPSGAYDLTIVYTSESNTDGSQGGVYDNAGEVYFDSSQNAQAVMMDSLILDDAHSAVTGKLWVAAGSHIADLKLHLIYEGTGVLQVKSILLQEAKRYRIMRLLFAAIFFCVIDVILLLFLSNQKDTRIHVKAQYRKYLLLFGLTMLVSLPEFSNYLFHGHDLAFHLQRIASVSAALRNGQFPVRMDTDMLNGYGYANSLYYCDIFLYLPAVLYAMMVPLRTCYQIYVVVIHFSTAFVMYYSLQKITRNKRIIWIGVILYVFAAYRLSDVYVRAAVGEYTALVFLPLVVLGCYQICQAEKPEFGEWWPLALGMAGIIQSHILSCEMTCVFLVFYLVLTIRVMAQRMRLFAFAKGIGLSLILSAWFLIPLADSLLHMNVAVAGETTSVGKIQSTGLYLSQLLSLFGNASGEGYAAGMQNEFAMTIGPALLIGLVLIGYCLLHRTIWKIEESFQFRAMRSLVILALIASVFTLRIFPWDSVEAVFGKEVAQITGAIQLSWRYLAIVTVCLVFATCFALNIIKSVKPGIINTMLLLLFFTTILYSGFFFYQYTSTAEEVSWNSDSNRSAMWVQGGEYYLKGTDVVAIDDTTVKTEDNYCVVIAYQNSKGKRLLTVKNLKQEDTQVTIPVFHYDYYVAKETETGTFLPVSTGENNKVVLTIPGEYAGTIEISYHPPVLWRVAELVSVLSWILVILFGWRKKIFPSLRIQEKKEL